MKFDKCPKTKWTNVFDHMGALDRTEKSIQLAIKGTLLDTKDLSAFKSDNLMQVFKLKEDTIEIKGSVVDMNQKFLTALESYSKRVKIQDILRS